MKKQRFKPENVVFPRVWVGNGCLLMTALAMNCDVPLGSCWHRLTSNARREVICEIVDIYVVHWARRNGLATQMLKQLLNDYGMLRTGTGTKTGGAALLKSMGWKQNKQTADWYLVGKIQKV